MKVKHFASADAPEAAYIGIDPSLTGFAVCAMEGDKYDIRVMTSELRGPARLHDIRNYLADYLGSFDVKDIAIEGTVRQSPSASVLGELTGVVKEYLYSAYSIIPINVPPLTLKKYVVGNARGVTKSLMMLQTYKKWGVEVTDDNAADAYGLARMCAGKSDTAYEVEAVLKMGDEKYRH